MVAPMSAMVGMFHPHATGDEAPSTLPVEAAQRFRCNLDDQPDHLVPRHQMAVPEQTRSSLVLNPDCWHTRGGLLPELYDQIQLLENFELDDEILWVRDVGPSGLRPFWLGSKLKKALSGMSLRGLVPTKLPEHVLRVLTLCGVFIENDSSRANAWKETVRRCSDEFQQKGYAPIARFIHPFHVSALRRYYRRLIRMGKLDLGDIQSSLRYIAHNEPVARFFHHQLTRAVSEIAGQPLKPSYVYFASYMGGANLPKHIDREQCEVSITFCLDYSPEPECQTPWPIHLHTPAGKITVFQAIGDGLVYRGRQLPHSRDQLPKGHSSTSIFFHYVPVDFDGPLD